MTEIKRVKVKICLVGEAATGKGELIRRFVAANFDDEHIQTLGTKVSKRLVPVTLTDGTHIDVDMMVWDITGQKGFLELHKEAYFQGANGILAVCDATRKKTLDDLNDWIEGIFSATGKIPVVFLANKAELVDARQVTEEDLKAAAEAYGGAYFFTSTKTGENVERAFQILAQRIVSKGFATRPPEEEVVGGEPPAGAAGRQPPSEQPEPNASVGEMINDPDVRRGLERPPREGGDDLHEPSSPTPEMSEKADPRPVGRKDQPRRGVPRPPPYGAGAARIVVVGDREAKKNALLAPYVAWTPDSRYAGEIECWLGQKKVEVLVSNEQTYLDLSIRDIVDNTGSRDQWKRFDFTGAEGILAVCDGTILDTLLGLDEWIKGVRSVVGNVPTFILVRDLEPGRRAFQESDVARLADAYHASSAFAPSDPSRAREVVHGAFTWLAERVVANRRLAPPSPARPIVRPLGHWRMPEKPPWVSVSKPPPTTAEMRSIWMAKFENLAYHDDDHLMFPPESHDRKVAFGRGLIWQKMAERVKAASTDDEPPVFTHRLLEWAQSWRKDRERSRGVGTGAPQTGGSFPDDIRLSLQGEAQAWEYIVTFLEEVTQTLDEGWDWSKPPLAVIPDEPPSVHELKRGLAWRMDAASDGEMDLYLYPFESPEFQRAFGRRDACASMRLHLDGLPEEGTPGDFLIGLQAFAEAGLAARESRLERDARVSGTDTTERDPHKAHLEGQMEGWKYILALIQRNLDYLATHGESPSVNEEENPK